MNKRKGKKSKKLEITRDFFLNLIFVDAQNRASNAHFLKKQKKEKVKKKCFESKNKAICEK